jgi:DNA-binding transcriptional ArsR family regulator
MSLSLRVCRGVASRTSRGGSPRGEPARGSAPLTTFPIGYIHNWQCNAALLDRTFAALADPTRRAILARLTDGPATVTELGRPFGLRQPTISKHLRILEEAGLIRHGKDAQRRPRELIVGALQDVDAWLRPFREQWERRFDNLEAHLGTMTKRTTPKKERP